MKIFAPNRLIQIVQKIERDHPLIGVEKPVISKELLRELVLRIQSCPADEIESLSAILSKRDIQSLCRYMQNNIYEVDLQKISSVIEYRFDKVCFQILFRVWQNNPDCIEALQLLGDHDKKEFWPIEISLEPDSFKSWAKAKQPILAVARNLNESEKGKTFAQKYAIAGFSVETQLYYKCYAVLLSSANLTMFQTEGDTFLADLMSCYPSKEHEKILLRLLRVVEDRYKNLTPFHHLYKYAFQLWGSPNRLTFPDEDTGLFEAYRWWHNYENLSEILGNDKRRMDFWMGYLSNGEWNVIRTHNMLEITFGTKIVIEFLEIGPVYLFNQNYYNDAVVPIIKANNTNGLKSWLYNKADYLSRDTHNQRWEINQANVLRKFGITK